MTKIFFAPSFLPAGIHMFFMPKIMSFRRITSRYKWVYLFSLLHLFCLDHNPVSADSLIKQFSNSFRLNISEKEKDHLSKLQALNEQIKDELAQKSITDVLNYIENKELEKKILFSFLNIISMRKYRNDRINKRLQEKTYSDDSERKLFRRAYQLLMVNLVPEDIRKWTYLYPIIMPFANYVKPGSIKISDINEEWFKSEKNFKFCFFYLYRKFANLDKTGKTYNSLFKKRYIFVDNGPERLNKFFNREVGFEFFEEKFNTGIFNKQSKFFDFDGYTFKYLKNEHQPHPQQSSLIKIFKTYSVYKAYCNDCDMLNYYNKRKLKMFEELVFEIELSLRYNASALDRYLKPLYYLSRTFPNLSAFTLTQVNGEYKFTAHEKKSPVLERLKVLWKLIEHKESDPAKAVEKLQYILGSIYLLPQKEISVSEEDYTFDRSGYATYIQDYISIYSKFQTSSE
jgi:hypothetical protein